jgi:hypothetical protein
LPSQTELDKVPKNLGIKEYYRRIFEWYNENKNLVLKGTDTPNKWVRLRLNVIEKLPEPNSAAEEDIAFVCDQIIRANMEWAYTMRDTYGIQMAAYAGYILDNFFDGLYGNRTKNLVQICRLNSELSSLKRELGIE